MKHFGIFVSDLESEAFLSATNDQIATWLFLHALCSKQCNGGTIADATSHPERFWTRHGISPEIIAQPSPLWTWSDCDLSVHPYDIGGETLYLKKSKGGKLGNEKRWKGTDNRTPNRTPNPPDQTRPNQTRPDQTSPNGSSSGDEGGFFNADLETTLEANQFASWFKSSLPQDQQDRLPKNWQATYAKAYRDLRHLDRRTHDEIMAVCRWARTDSFWSGNFRSPTKLRQRDKQGTLFFDVFAERMKSTPTTTTTVNLGHRKPRFPGIQEDLASQVPQL